MKVVKITIELVIDNEPRLFDPVVDKDAICGYLNNKLYNDPEFFGEFGPENIESVEDWE